MKKVLIVTHIPFWRKNCGDGARLYALAHYLSEFTELTVAFGGEIPEDEQPTIRRVKQQMDLVWIRGDGGQDMTGYVKPFITFFTNRLFDVCIIEHVFLSFFIPFIPKHVKLILDAHDIVSDRMESLAKMTIPVRLSTDVSTEQENAYFKAFDIVMMIQKNDLEKVSKVIGRRKTILAPHPVSMPKMTIRRRVNTIGFVASGYPPNVESINWFLDHVWPLVEHAGITLEIYGHVCASLKRRRTGSVVMNGFIADQDLIYQDIDIVINPVRNGAGLKIKNVEALGSGLPLITTTHGAMGIEDGIGRSFLVADDHLSFSRHILHLVEDYDRRKELGDEAYKYALYNFSPEQCFRSLLLEINRPKVFA